MASQTRTRNYTTEKENGQLELWRGLEIVREERLKDTFDILQLAQIFVFCSLPYRPTDERQISHTARLGDGSTVEVIFTAMRPDVSIAFGNDRGLLTGSLIRLFGKGHLIFRGITPPSILHIQDREKGGATESCCANDSCASHRRQLQSCVNLVCKRIRPSCLSSGGFRFQQASRQGNISEKLDRRKGRTSFGLQFDEDFVKTS